MSKRIPNPELDLTKEELAIYRKIAKFLIEQGSYCEVDTFMIAQAARSWVRYRELERRVVEEGSVQVYQNGATNVSGWYSAMSKERTMFITIADKLGLNAASRDKISSFVSEANSPGGIVAKMQKLREQKSRRV